jgi:SNF2 family DNA or RNA helicase
MSHAGVVIQTEPWWNRSIELQALSRVHRQGQTDTVLYVRMEASNSAIDAEIIAVQKKKSRINEILMAPLIRRHDEGPADIDIPIWIGFSALPYQFPKE